MLRRNLHTVLVFISIAALSVLLMLQFRWTGGSGKDWETIVQGDGKDYYSYLEQIFISHDFGKAPVDHDRTIDVNGSSVIKYYCGTALLLSPFFLGSMLVCSVFDLPVDGYTEVFQKPVSIAALLYMLLGLWFLLKLLRQLQVKPANIYLTLIFIFFATHLLNYTLTEPAMSHVYSFSVISGLLWVFNSFLISKKQKYLFTAAVLMGIIYLVRPVNLIIAVFLLFFFSDVGSVLQFFRQNWRKLIIALIIMLAVMSIQHILWFIQCGKFFLWSYPGEGFYLLHPQVYNVLFSFRKGLFIYTPFILITLFGFIVIFRENKFRFLVSLFFFIAITYIISAWWCWTYFDGFSMRPFVDFFAVFAIFFALLIGRLGRWLRRILVMLCLILVALNLVQSYQYHARIIHNEYMNFESYKFVFLRISPKYSDWIGGSSDLAPYNKYKKTLIAEKTLKGDTLMQYDAGRRQTDPVLFYDDLIEFYRNVSFRNDTALLHAHPLFAEISLKKWEFMPNGTSGAYFVVALSYGGAANAYYNSFRLNYLPFTKAGQWQELRYDLILPYIQKPDFKLSFYIWNKGLQYFLVKDLNVKIYKTA